MAGKKKTKKPAANPARGFATTSVASKPRVDAVDGADETAGSTNVATPATADATATATNQSQNGATAPTTETTKTLSPEEFERQLEESELQLMIEKYAQKVRRDV